MSKRILIPTNFDIESLNILRFFLQNNTSDNTYDILFVHGYSVSESINDLLFFSKNKTIEKLTNQDFEEACNIICNKFASSINSIVYDVFTGYTQAAFNNFIEGRKIDLAIISNSKKTPKTSRKSFSLIPFINKSKVNKLEIKVPQYEKAVQEGNLTELFLAEVQLGW